MRFILQRNIHNRIYDTGLSQVAIPAGINGCLVVAVNNKINLCFSNLTEIIKYNFFSLSVILYVYFDQLLFLEPACETLVLATSDQSKGFLKQLLTMATILPQRLESSYCNPPS